MKLVSLFAAVALASAAAPPRISLDLSGTSVTRSETPHAPHDYMNECPANNSTIESCPFPVARAYDHKDKDISSDVETRVYLMDLDGESCKDSTLADCKVDSVAFNQRATYVFQYHVADEAGNKAEVVTFELVLNDLDKPGIAICGLKSETWEAMDPDEAERRVCGPGSATKDLATDNVDDDATMQSRMEYQLYAVDTDSVESTRICPASGAAKEWFNYEDEYSCAITELHPKNVGRYLLTLKVCDRAGTDDGYEYSASPPNDNCRVVNKAFVIEDTTPPVITVNGYGESGSPALKHECSEPYTETYPATTWPKNSAITYSAEAADNLDDALELIVPIVVTGAVDTAKIDTYTLEYDAEDSNGRHAIQKTRRVEVVDRRPPTVVLPEGWTNKDVHDVFVAPDTYADLDVGCSDDCDTGIAPPEKTWVGQPFNDRVANACYTRRYTCTDATGLSSYEDREVCIKDKGAPEIIVMGEDDLTIEASNTQEYTDEGATCMDYVDGVLSHAVEVSGQVVNMRVPGLYTIKYECMDLSDNPAEDQFRNVTVEDTTCPVVNVTGDTVVYLEAGFAYNDAGATAWDNLNGNITADILPINDNINTANSFHSRRSCREIHQTYAEATSGWYYITTFSTVNDEFQRQKVFCHMSDADDHTLFPVKDDSCDGSACAAVVPYGAAQGDCDKFGLKMLDLTHIDQGNTRTALAAGFVTEDCDVACANATAAAYLPTTAQDGTSDLYLCGTNDEKESDVGTHMNNAKMNHLMTHDKISDKEIGKYIISYTVKDKSNNTECKPTPTRTVVIKDTLPPVIHLHVRNPTTLDVKDIHKSESGQEGLNGHINDAETHSWADETLTHHTDSQTTSVVLLDPEALAAVHASKGVDAWALAGVASAVAGVALLGLAVRKSHAVSDVVEV